MELPEVRHTVTPYFTVSDADQLIDFLVDVFDGVAVAMKRYPTGRIQHARVRIGDSVIMVNESTERYPVNVSQMHIFVDDADSVYAKALANGANTVMELNDRPYGDRMGGVKDPCGNIWWIATQCSFAKQRV